MCRPSVMCLKFEVNNLCSAPQSCPYPCVMTTEAKFNKFTVFLLCIIITIMIIIILCYYHYHLPASVPLITGLLSFSYSPLSHHFCYFIIIFTHYLCHHHVRCPFVTVHIPLSSYPLPICYLYYHMSSHHYTYFFSLHYHLTSLTITHTVIYSLS